MAWMAGLAWDGWSGVSEFTQRGWGGVEGGGRREQAPGLDRFGRK